jgi:response regulator NasT
MIVCKAQSPPAKALTSPPADAALKILVIDKHPIRRAILDTGLREAGLANVILLDDTTGLLDRIYKIDPDVILIDLENPSRDVLEQMFQVSRIVRRPIAMFVDQSDRDTTKAAVEAGVSAYIVGGLRKERVKDILELCISRFNAVARLQEELDRTRDALEARKTIDRAKGILMQLKGLSEEDAYALLRKTAMNEKRKIADVAQSVITATELLK